MKNWKKLSQNYLQILLIKFSGTIILTRQLCLFRVRIKRSPIIPYLPLLFRQVSANSVDSDQMLQNASVYTVCYLPSNFFTHINKYSKFRASMARSYPYCSLETLKRVIGKQCRPRSDAHNAASDQGPRCLQIV